MTSHNTYPFNDAGEPLCTAEQYRRDCEDDASYDDFDSFDYNQREAASEAFYEDVAERLGVYDDLTHLTCDLVNRHELKVHEAVEEVLSEVVELADILGETYVEHDDWNTAPSDRLLAAARLLFDHAGVASEAAAQFLLNEEHDRKGGA